MKFLKKKKVITRGDNTPYLERWNIFECRYFSIKLHHLLLSDDDCLHDHPWAFISLILWNGYIEHRDIPIKPSVQMGRVVTGTKWETSYTPEVDSASAEQAKKEWLNTRVQCLPSKQDAFDGKTPYRAWMDELTQYPDPYPQEKFNRIQKRMYPMTIIYRKPTDRHKIEIVKPAWTLVLTFKKVREWGFWTKSGFIKWFDYKSTSNCE